MNPTDHRLPGALEAAIAHVNATAQSVAERVATGLAAQAQSATRIAERDLLLAAQIDLRRKMNTFHLSFARTLTDHVRADVAPRAESRRRLADTDWQSLSLVDDREVEQRMFSDRIGQQISHACEWELRELSGYMGAVLRLGSPDEERNPLRGEALGHAVFRAVEAVTPDADGRKLLAREFGQAMAAAMPACYRAIVQDLQQRRVQPVGLALRTVHGPGHTANSGYASMRDAAAMTRPGDFAGSGGDGPTQPMRLARESTSGGGTSGGGTSGPGAGPITRSGLAAARAAGPRVTPEADAQLMALLRRLTVLASRPGALGDAPPGAAGGPGAADASRAGNRLHGAIGVLATQAAGAAGDTVPEPLTGLMAVNLIRAHRDELVQASTGKLDHMVIDVVGSLFDQILSDPKVPPQMARQIARLQLPVLRVALVDASFFSSRRHPVRRFVNRIASLACAFDEFDDGPGRDFLAQVRSLVQEIVEGDFDQVALYEAKLEALECFIAEQTQQGAQASGTATVLETKESELRIQQRYMLQLSTALADIAMPDYVRDFVAQVWSQALVLAARRHGADSDMARRFRAAGRDAVMSVQPRGSPVLRKRFLLQLPTLMKDLNEGLKLIGWPASAQKDFFSRLLISHAESLKAAPTTELEHNLLAKQLEGIFHAGIPGAHEISSAEPVTLASQEIEQRFTPDEARQVGLVEESAVDWSGEVDIDLGGVDPGDTVPQPGPGAADAGDTTQPSGLDVGLDIDLGAAEPAEPSHGAALMDHIRLGFAYQMLLRDQWQKVRLSYVSPGRSFFVFTRGSKHQEIISLTARMLARMCEAHRLRAVEHAYLMERATARARRQLAEIKVAARH